VFLQCSENVRVITRFLIITYFWKKMQTNLFVLFSSRHQLGKLKNTRAADKNFGGNIFGEFFTISSAKHLETNLGRKIRPNIK
jgi:hypothetical protein